MMFILSVLVTSSHAQNAIDCQGRTHVCDIVNEAAPAANLIESGSEVGFLDQSGPARARLTNLYADLNEANTSVEAMGCTVDGWTAGQYRRGELDLSWAVLDTPSQPGLGTYGGPPTTFTGTYTDGGSTGDFGDASTWSSYVGGQLAGTRSDGFMAGRYIRIRGRRGVVAALNGSCPGDTATALDGWFRGDLSAFVETCSDGVLNGSETQVDCGGPDCAPCSISPDNVLVYYDFDGRPEHASAAALRLGASNVVHTTSAANFATQFDQGGWDIVVVHMSNEFDMPSQVRDRAIDTVLNGGRLNFSWFNLQSDPGLMSVLGVSSVQPYSTPAPLYPRSGAPTDLFDLVESVTPPLQSDDDFFNANGWTFSGSGVCLISESSPTGGCVSMALQGRRVLVNGFLPQDYVSADADMDTVLDMVELLQNQFHYQRN